METSRLSPGLSPRFVPRFVVCPQVCPYPYPPDVMQKMQQADQALIPTERFAQQVEKIVNGELQADKKKQ